MCSVSNILHDNSPRGETGARWARATLPPMRTDRSGLDTDRVSALIAEVCDRLVLPRFRRLAPGEVEEKSPGDPVTIADREAEEALTAVLAREDPGAVVLGEEAIAAEPELLASLDAAGRVWLIDPVDGTGNFAAGNPDFGTMLVELEDGRPRRSWIWQAVRRRMLQATLGHGVRVDGRPLAAPRPRRPLLVGGVTPEFAALRADGLAPAWPMTGSCTADYPLIALGERDYLIHNGRHPWDHWPGVLLLGELGGVVRFMDGQPYRSRSDNPHKVVAARSEEAWQLVAEAGLLLLERGSAAG